MLLECPSPCWHLFLRTRGENLMKKENKENLAPDRNTSLIYYCKIKYWKEKWLLRFFTGIFLMDGEHPKSTKCTRSTNSVKCGFIFIITLVWGLPSSNLLSETVPRVKFFYTHCLNFWAWLIFLPRELVEVSSAESSTWFPGWTSTTRGPPTAATANNGSKLKQ